MAGHPNQQWEVCSGMGAPTREHGCVTMSLRDIMHNVTLSHCSNCASICYMKLVLVVVSVILLQEERCGETWQLSCYYLAQSQGGRWSEIRLRLIFIYIFLFFTESQIALLFARGKFGEVRNDGFGLSRSVRPQLEREHIILLYSLYYSM